jgi:membrane-associated protease RseP (regulator of RpoE activity)
MLAPLGFVIALSFGIQRMSAATAQLLFWIYAAVMGLSMAGIFPVFTGMSIARVFFIAAGMFAGMSLYGYTTKTDLTRFGSFLFMGLIGIVIASLVNLFVGSTALQFAISVIGVIVTDQRGQGRAQQSGAVGLKLAPLSDELRRQANVPADVTGVLVRAVAPDSPAAGVIEPGDVIVSINKQPVTDPADGAKKLQEAIRAKQAVLLVNHRGSNRFVALPAEETRG